MRRLAQSALLTLRRRRALMVWASMLAIGVPALIEIVLVVLHADDPASRSAGGADTYTHVASTLDLVLVVMAALIGTTAGAGDLAAGTFRDLVATGQSRTRLFLARIPAALAISVPLGAAGIAVVTGAAYLLADGRPTPSTAQAAGIVVHVLVVVAAGTVVAVGLAEAVGSRGIAIGVFLGWILAGEQLLLNVSILGRGRELLLAPSLDRLRPLLVDDSRMLSMSLLAAGITVAAWCIVATAGALWRVQRRDA
jgi:ABC-type transport system involved in multi-copper enzyme maturation permease subunit